jgi:ribosomal protein S18 acetylase RimI-like enzyme
MTSAGDNAPVAIRDATVADLPRVAEIKVRNWGETYSSLVDSDVLAPFLDVDRQLDGLRKSFGQPGTLLLVALDQTGTISGFALTYLDREPDPWLESLHVVSEARGGGVGTRLMRATADRLLDAGYRTLRLGVVTGNAGAARLYERLGASLTGQEPASWADGVWHEIYRWPDISTIA